MEGSYFLNHCFAKVDRESGVRSRCNLTLGVGTRDELRLARIVRTPRHGVKKASCHRNEDLFKVETNPSSCN